MLSFLTTIAFSFLFAGAPAAQGSADAAGSCCPAKPACSAACCDKGCCSDGCSCPDCAACCGAACGCCAGK